MDKKNCCAKCSRKPACKTKPRSKYFCQQEPCEWCYRCMPLRCFRAGSPDAKGQTKMFGGEERTS